MVETIWCDKTKARNKFQKMHLAVNELGKSRKLMDSWSLQVCV